MRVRVVSFGPLRSVFPNGATIRELQDGDTVRALLDGMLAEGVLEHSAIKSAAIAVNHEYADENAVLKEGDEVALLPPVSGGAGPMIRLVHEPIASEAITGTMKAGADGAMVVFDGIVRDNTRGRQTLHLDYEAYEEMALRQMSELREQAIAQLGVRDVAIVHRLGRLVVGETSVLIVVAAAHRGAAFDACRWVIDTLKKNVPIWKREQFVDGAVWADGEAFPEDMDGAKR